MNEAALKLAPEALRVSVVAADPARRARLLELVRNLHHEVGAPGDADVVLTDDSKSNELQLSGTAGGLNQHAGARLPRDAGPEQIDAALRAVAVGLSVRVADDARDGFAALPETDERLLLTPRETEVLNAVASGLTNKEIARRLEISQHTVKFHLESLMHKLGVSSRAEAVSKSMRLHLLEPYRL
jgi:DNA-binding NarL/FixJ family response regulator